MNKNIRESLQKLLPKIEKEVAKAFGTKVEFITASWDGKEIHIEIRK